MDNLQCWLQLPLGSEELNSALLIVGINKIAQRQSQVIMNFLGTSPDLTNTEKKRAFLKGHLLLCNSASPKVIFLSSLLCSP